MFILAIATQRMMSTKALSPTFSPPPDPPNPFLNFSFTPDQPTPFKALNELSSKVSELLSEDNPDKTKLLKEIKSTNSYPGAYDEVTYQGQELPKLNRLVNMIQKSSGENEELKIKILPIAYRLQRELFEKYFSNREYEYPISGEPICLVYNSIPADKINTPVESKIINICTEAMSPDYFRMKKVNGKVVGGNEPDYLNSVDIISLRNRFIPKIEALVSHGEDCDFLEDPLQNAVDTYKNARNDLVASFDDEETFRYRNLKQMLDGVEKEIRSVSTAEKALDTIEEVTDAMYTILIEARARGVELDKDASPRKVALWEADFMSGFELQSLNSLAHRGNPFAKSAVEKINERKELIYIHAFSAKDYPFKTIGALFGKFQSILGEAGVDDRPKAQRLEASIVKDLLKFEREAASLKPLGYVLATTSLDETDRNEEFKKKEEAKFLRSLGSSLEIEQTMGKNPLAAPLIPLVDDESFLRTKDVLDIDKHPSERIRNLYSEIEKTFFPDLHKDKQAKEVLFLLMDRIMDSKGSYFGLHSGNDLVTQERSFLKEWLIKNLTEQCTRYDSSLAPIIDEEKNPAAYKALEIVNKCYQELIEGEIPLATVRFGEAEHPKNDSRTICANLSELIKALPDGSKNETVTDSLYIIWHKAKEVEQFSISSDDYSNTSCYGSLATTTFGKLRTLTENGSEPAALKLRSNVIPALVSPMVADPGEQSGEGIDRRENAFKKEVVRSISHEHDLREIIDSLEKYNVNAEHKIPVDELKSSLDQAIINNAKLCLKLQSSDAYDMLRNYKNKLANIKTGESLKTLVLIYTTLSKRNFYDSNGLVHYTGEAICDMCRENPELTKVIDDQNTIIKLGLQKYLKS